MTPDARAFAVPSHAAAFRQRTANGSAPSPVASAVASAAPKTTAAAPAVTALPEASATAAKCSSLSRRRARCRTPRRLGRRRLQRDVQTLFAQRPGDRLRDLARRAVLRSVGDEHDAPLLSIVLQCGQLL